MSDMTLIAEDILEVMRAMDKAYYATQVLREKTDPVAFDEFRVKMSELQERLEKIKMVLDNEEAYAMDELIDALNHAYTTHDIHYRRTPRMREKE